MASAAVASEQQSNSRPTPFTTDRVVIRESRSGHELWHTSANDLGGGTSPAQLLGNVERDLGELSVGAFAAKYGFSL